MSTKLPYGGNWTIPEKKQKGGWRYTYLIRNTEKSFQSPLEICKIAWHLFLEMPSLGQKPSKIHHGNSTWVFLDHPWKFHFGFLIDPLEFPHAFFRHLLPLAAWNFHFLRVNPPPAFFFFWNGPFQRSKIKTWEISQLSPIYLEIPCQCPLTTGFCLDFFWNGPSPINSYPSTVPYIYYTKVCYTYLRPKFKF